MEYRQYVAHPLKAPYNRVTTEYGRRGDSWSCNKDSSGRGVHTGVDFAAPKGTPIYAPCDGQIRHRSYGAAFGTKQFAISPDPGQTFADGEIFFAHTTTRMADGVYVKLGQQIALVGAEGNATGPHLHMEYHPTVKNSWNCSVHADPKPVLIHGASAGAPYVTAHVYRSKCGYGEPTNGDTSSDTIKELQERLNRAGLTGGVKLVVSGRYDENTDKMVRLWQEQVCDDTPDTIRKSYLGPNQFKTMFPDEIYNLVDDHNPQIANPPTTTITSMGKRFQRANKYVTAPVKYSPNWDSDIIAGDGSWTPSFFVLHHTAIASDPDKGASSLGYILSGGGYAPVRLCNWLVDRDGTLQVIAARKSYHAGKGTGFGVPVDSMNYHSAGVEIESMGKEPDFTDAQILTVSQLATGWFEEFKVDDTKALNHKDWSSTGKKDTLYTMSWWRHQFKTWDKPTEPPVTIPPVEPPKTITFPLGIQYHYSGKPAGTMTFKGDYKKLDVAPWAPKKDGLTLGMVYLNVTGKGEFRVRLMRDPDDATAYQTYILDGKNNFLVTHVWFESGEKDRKLWFELSSMNGETFTVNTRYAKFASIPWNITVVLGAAKAAKTWVQEHTTKKAA